MKFNFCPQCGTKLIEKEIGDEGMLPFCIKCSRPFFDWFGQCVIVTVINEFNEVLLLKQNYVSESFWVLVAGYIKKGQTAEETAIREVLEESGQESEILKYIKSYYIKERNLLMLGYLMKVKKKSFSKSVEVDDIAWYSFDQAILKVKKGSTAIEHLNNCNDL